MKYKEIQLAENLIASKRSEMDKSLSEIQGVHFFFSAVTGTTTNKKKAKSSNADKSQSSQPTKDSEKSNKLKMKRKTMRI